MTHKVKFIGNSSYNWEGDASVFLHFNVGSGNGGAPGFNVDNGYLYFSIKHSSWSNIDNLRIYMSPSSGLVVSSGYYYTVCNSLQDNVAGENGWHGFRIPLSIDGQSGPSFDVSSLFTVSIGAFFQDDGHGMTVDNVYLEYGDEISDDSQFTLVSCGGGDGISIMPEWDYKSDMKKLQKEHRLNNSNLFIYKTGEYKKINFGVEFFPVSAAMAVNSLWNTNTPCVFLAANSGTVEISDVILSGKSKPFRKFQKPYVDLMKGTIKLEGY